MIQNFAVDLLQVETHDTRGEMGKAAAAAVHHRIIGLMKTRQEINMLFAAAPSQNEFLAALLTYSDIDWTRINALHMDEYIGLSPDAPQGFGNFLKAAIFSKAPFRSVHYLDGNAPHPAMECVRYSALLAQMPLDIACTGIGENGHIAFNDPHVANFEDESAVKEVTLDSVCRMQQVYDGCFQNIQEVPSTALTLTIPAILQAEYIVCVVPGRNKAKAVAQALQGSISEACPASVLRRHKNATLYLEKSSADLL